MSVSAFMTVFEETVEWHV